ncbi:hypothetical protein [Clostridium tagluense]|uniref:hypothetical protein n=1 Tax=Clostridium tagluense TaxID=360422 RepID=UPI001CF4E2B7|nr:hypothetical protein [Clostridium tagluense]MCB2300815.1 hypothetical protein [Clostridium tagluense]
MKGINNMRLVDAEKIVIERYPEADVIYSLARKKAKWSTIEKVTEVAIFLFTPFVNGLEQANGISDLGIYYLVEQNERQLLVRVAKFDKENALEEKDITGEFIGKEYVVGKDKFEKLRDIKKEEII